MAEKTLKGRTALITGSTSTGMGRSIALRLAAEGANIVLNYGTHRDFSTHDGGADAQARAEEVASHIRRLGGQAIIAPGDTRSEEDTIRMVDAAKKAFGAIDILVLAAGGKWKPQPLESVTIDFWRDVMAAEVDAMFLAFKHVIPGMRARKWGRIIVFSMNGAMTRKTLEATAADYTIGKTARTWLSLAVGHDEFEHGITVNIIEPGPVGHMTLNEALAAIEHTDDAWEKRPKPVAHDAAELAAFLCSEAGRFVSQSLIRYPTDGW